MPCINCGSEKVLARGYCTACYTRLRRTGSLERTNIKRGGNCAECDKAVFARGLCHYHYARNKHPLYNTWKLIRSRYPNETPKKWDYFEHFLNDVGERPSPLHQLRRMDDAEPYSANNVMWVEPVLQTERPAYSRDWMLNRTYGLSIGEFDKILAKQNGVCAICEQPETARNRKTGELRSLAVDHCHRKLHVRALLCSSCNRMLGLSKDNPSVLRKAADYLEYHDSRIGADPLPEGYKPTTG